MLLPADFACEGVVAVHRRVVKTPLLFSSPVRLAISIGQPCVEHSGGAPPLADPVHVLSGMVQAKHYLESHYVIRGDPPWWTPTKNLKT